MLRNKIVGLLVTSAESIATVRHWSKLINEMKLYDLVIFARSLTRFLHRTTVTVTGSGALMLAVSSSLAMSGFVSTFKRV